MILTSKAFMWMNLITMSKEARVVQSGEVGSKVKLNLTQDRSCIKSLLQEVKCSNLKVSAWVFSDESKQLWWVRTLSLNLNIFGDLYQQIGFFLLDQNE